MAEPPGPGTPFLCSCRYCSDERMFFAPLWISKPSAFVTQCAATDCSRSRAFDSVFGAISEELEGKSLPFVPKLKSKGGPLEEFADHVANAAELYTFGLMNRDPNAKDAAFSGAAVHLRLAGEAIAGGYILGRTRQQRRDETLRSHLSALNGHRRRGVRATHGGQRRIGHHFVPGLRSSTIVSLDTICRLGDTAAHVLLRDPSRELPPTRMNLQKGFEAIEQIVGGIVW